MGEVFQIRRASSMGVGVVPKVGGAPDAVGPLSWPSCRDCGQKMAFLFQMPEVPGAVSWAPRAAAYVFQCENPRTACSRWSPDSGANAAMALARGEARVEGAPEAAPAYPEQPLQLVADPWGGWSQLGGLPRWRQDEETPRCCGAPMAFVMQLASEDFGLRFGDDGVGYLFRCSKVGSEHALRFLTQSA